MRKAPLSKSTLIILTALTLKTALTLSLHSAQATTDREAQIQSLPYIPDRNDEIVLLISDLHLPRGHYKRGKVRLPIGQALFDMVSYYQALSEQYGWQLSTIVAGDVFDFKPWHQRIAAQAAGDPSQSDAQLLEARLRHIAAEEDPQFFEAWKVIRRRPVHLMNGNADRGLGFANVIGAFDELSRESGSHPIRIDISRWFHLHRDIFVHHGDANDPMSVLSEPSMWQQNERILMPVSSRVLMALFGNDPKEGPFIRSERLQQAATPLIGPLVEDDSLWQSVNTTRQSRGQEIISADRYQVALKQLYSLRSAPWDPDFDSLRSRQGRKEVVNFVRHSVARIYQSLHTKSLLSAINQHAIEEFANIVVHGHYHKARRIELADQRVIADLGSFGTKAKMPTFGIAICPQKPSTPSQMHIFRWDANHGHPVRHLPVD